MAARLEPLVLHFAPAIIVLDGQVGGHEAWEVGSASSRVTYVQQGGMVGSVPLAFNLRMQGWRGGNTLGGPSSQAPAGSTDWWDGIWVVCVQQVTLAHR